LTKRLQWLYKRFIVANDFSRDCYAEVARIEKEHKIRIELTKVEGFIPDLKGKQIQLQEDN